MVIICVFDSFIGSPVSKLTGSTRPRSSISSSKDLKTSVSSRPYLKLLILLPLMNMSLSHSKIASGKHDGAYHAALNYALTDPKRF